MAEYVILIYEDENGYATAAPDAWQQAMEAHNRFAEQVGEMGGKIIRATPCSPRHGHVDPRRRRHRRPVRRDQGGARRLLPDRGPGSGSRPGDRQALPGAGSAASRCAR